MTEGIEIRVKVNMTAVKFFSKDIAEMRTPPTLRYNVAA